MNKLPQANKTLGQHFLRDQNIITKITTDFSLDCDIIVEVGPGPAVLTRNLAAHKKPFFVIEKDDRFIYGILWTHNRDSGLLSLSNHHAILNRLVNATPSGMGKRYITQYITEVTWRHWAVGYIYGILIPLYVATKSGNKIPIQYLHNELEDIEYELSKYPIIRLS